MAPQLIITYWRTRGSGKGHNYRHAIIIIQLISAQAMDALAILHHFQLADQRQLAGSQPTTVPLFVLTPLWPDRCGAIPVDNLAKTTLVQRKLNDAAPNHL